MSAKRASVGWTIAYVKVLDFSRLFQKGIPVAGQKYGRSYRAQTGSRRPSREDRVAQTPFDRLRDYKANDEQQIKRAFNRAKDRELQVGIYTQPLFATRNEDGNHSEIGKYTDEEQDLVGIAIYGDNRKVSKALNGLKFRD